MIMTTASRSTLTLQPPWPVSQNSPATTPMYFTCEDHSEILKTSKISKHGKECKYEKIAMIIIMMNFLLIHKSYQVNSQPNHTDRLSHLGHHLVTKLADCCFFWAVPYPTIIPRNILSVGSFVGLSETEKNNQSQYKTDRHRLGHRPVSTGHHGRRRQGRGHHGRGLCFDGSFCGLKIGERTVKHSNYNSQ